MNSINAIEWIEGKLQKKILAYATIAVAALISYCNSFTVPFLLDDFGSISNNYAIQKLFDFAALWKFYANRIVLYFTLSINYAIHDNGVEGYHVTNLMIHILNGILFYLILKTILSLPYFKETLISHYNTSISVIAAVLFVCHPIQVNAVTYIVQRTASLAATFYMLAILFFINYRLRGKLYRYLLTFLFTLLAMFTKENTITIPFMLLLIEFMFFLKDGKTSWFKRILIFLPLLATVPIIPATNLILKGYSQSDPNVSFKASTSMDRFQYFYTQLNVIILYIRLMFIPINQNFDYSNDYPVSTNLWENYSYVSLIILMLIGLSSIYTIKRNRLVSFGILWFFIGLAVESSFISIKDVYFEHRLYFPTAGFIMFLIGMLFYEKKQKSTKTPNTAQMVSDLTINEILKGIPEWQDVILHNETGEQVEALPEMSNNQIKNILDFYNTQVHRRYLIHTPIQAFLIIAILLIPLYTGLTIRRNYIYSDSIRLWSDVVKKAPGSDRAHSVLATGYLNAYSDKEKNVEYLDLAEQEFKKAIEMYYYNSTAHCNLSKVYLLKEEYQKCIDEARKTLNISNSEYANFNMGSAYKKLGKTQEALDSFKAGYDFNKRSTFILKALGDTYFETGNYEEAKKYYEEYLENNKRFNSKDVQEKLKQIEEKT